MGITDEQIAEIEKSAKDKKAGGFLLTHNLSCDNLIALVGRLREVEKDAARYRWLRKSNGQPQRSVFLDSLTTYDMDEAIDTAMQDKNNER